MRHFEALRGHFRQDLADPAHFVLVRTCKGHIHLDITNSSTSQAPASSSHFSRIPDPAHLPQDPAVSRILRSSHFWSPERQIREFPDSRLEAGKSRIPCLGAWRAPRGRIPAPAQEFPPRGRNPLLRGGNSPRRQGNPGFPARSGNPEFPGAGQEFLPRRAPRGDPPSDARFSILVFALCFTGVLGTFW